jgi:hypothetical protein
VRDEGFADALREFTQGRRSTLTALITSLGAPPERAALLAETAYALLWYRLLTAHAPLDRTLSDDVTQLILDATTPT